MAAFWSPAIYRADLGRRGAVRGIGSLPFWVGTLLARLVLVGMAPSDDIWRYM